MELSCPNEDDVLHVLRAMYGRLVDDFVCPSPNEIVVTNCSLNSSLEVVQTFCEGYHECKLPVEVASFGEDPCAGVFKYLDVDYECVSGLPVITDECKSQLFSLRSPFLFVSIIFSLLAQQRIQNKKFKFKNKLKSSNLKKGNKLILKWIPFC